MVEFAERVLMVEHVRGLSLHVRREREKCAMGCGGGGTSVELTIGLIGIARGDAGSEALANMLGQRLDGAGATELDCHVLARGPRFATYLRRLSSQRVVGKCEADFTKLRKRELADVHDVPVELVCRTPAQVEVHRKELLSGLKAGAQCDRLVQAGARRLR